MKLSQTVCIVIAAKGDVTDVCLGVDINMWDCSLRCICSCHELNTQHNYVLQCE